MKAKPLTMRIITPRGPPTPTLILVSILEDGARVEGGDVDVLVLGLGLAVEDVVVLE